MDKMLKPGNIAFISQRGALGGVVLDINCDKEVREAYQKIIQRAKEYNPNAEIQSITVQKMIKNKATK
ncbi:acetate--CoA ligase family protein [Candidatus Bathyarchaeota archaeon]|nr:acetate--CoA ligase family protein [Candidatus Bathyarchaeota archaeon]